MGPLTGRAVAIPIHGGREIEPPLFFNFDNWEFRWRNSIASRDWAE